MKFFQVLKVIFQIVTLIMPLVKGVIQILERNGFKQKK